VKFNNQDGLIVLDLIVDETQNEAIFSARDTGSGIPSSERKRIFQRFYHSGIYQYDNSGVGLGLYLTKLIVMAHHGRVWFHSKEMKGSTFYIAFQLMNENR
jgi:signal transduction histidine kinase